MEATTKEENLPAEIFYQNPRNWRMNVEKRAKDIHVLQRDCKVSWEAARYLKAEMQQ